MELVLIKISDPDLDEVTSIPERLLLREGEIHAPRLPFHLVIHRAFRNAQLTMANAGQRSLAHTRCRNPDRGAPVCRPAPRTTK